MGLEDKSVLITGGSGFIGKNLIKRLKQEGARIINISNDGEAEGAKTIDIDLTKTDFSFLDNLHFDYVIHLAGFSSPRRSIDEKLTNKLNVDATERLFKRLISSKIEKAVFMSSYIVYSSSNQNLAEDFPLEKSPGIYAKSKILAESCCDNLIRHGFPLVIFRLSNVYGPHQQWLPDEIPTLVPQLISDALTKKEMNIQNGNPVRDYIYVGDVVEAVIQAVRNNYAGTLNLGTGMGTSVRELANEISALTGSSAFFLNKDVVRAQRLVLDTSKAKNILNLTPKTSLREGLKKTISYYAEEIRT